MSKHSVREIERALLAKGFVLEKGRRHLLFRLWVNGKPVGKVFTLISHGERDVSENLFSLMARQLHLAKAQFRQLIECTLSHDGYVKLLREAGFLSL